VPGNPTESPNRFLLSPLNQLRVTGNHQQPAEEGWKLQEKGREDGGKASLDWFKLLRNLIFVAQEQQHVGLLSELNY